VWLEDWSVTETGPDVYRLQAAAQDEAGVRVALDLTLTDRKGPILQGDRGFSPKGPETGQASYYYSLTRLETAGQVQIGPNSYPVEGLSWKDHEYSTSALAQDQVGWDWFSIQLDHGYELMVFQIRKADGSVDPFSSGTLVAPDGSTTRLTQTDFSIQVDDTWESPRTGAVYPSAWTVRVPAADLTLNITPFLADQELNVSYAYWEGAVRIEGQQAGQAVRGAGYVELTGYSASMGGEF
jgi:predicted secreted hydrolase